jgi:hypothetical protein
MMTKSEAEKLFDLRNSVIADGCPLRFRPVIIAGPNDGEYAVVTLGEAKKLELA